MKHSLESKLARKYRISPEQAKALVEGGLGYPHKIKDAKKSDVEKLVGRSAADRIKPPVARDS